MLKRSFNPTAVAARNQNQCAAPAKVDRRTGSLNSVSALGQTIRAVLFSDLQGSTAIAAQPDLMQRRLQDTGRKSYIEGREYVVGREGVERPKLSRRFYNSGSAASRNRLPIISMIAPQRLWTIPRQLGAKGLWHTRQVGLLKSPPAYIADEGVLDAASRVC